MNYDNLKAIFELGRPITEDNSFPYIHLAYKLNKQNYRLITSGELFVRGRHLFIPQFLVQYMSYHNEAIMIANIVSGKVLSIVFRSINTNKEFMKVGTTKSTFYGLGELSNDFRYGMPILLVEGHLDRDMMASIYPNTLGVMTNMLSKSQVELLKGLTNKFILMLDNDEAGMKGQQQAKYQLKGCNILELKHQGRMKDAGDLVKLDITNHNEFEDIVEQYKLEIELFA
jgi:5S rRNA maturation endonuclease (ribonuclease M5)